MGHFLAIASNAFMELIRQPVFLLLVTASSMFEIFLACIPYFGFGDDPKMVQDSVLAVMLLSGMLSSVLSASASVAREIRSGTALAVLSKPVSRHTFLLAKYTGIAISLAALTYINLLAALLTSRMAYDAYGDTDKLALGIWSLFVAIAYLVGGFSNYFLRRPYVSDSLFALLICSTLAFITINFLDKSGKLQSFATDIDWRLVPASVLILFSTWVFAAIAVACSTRVDMIPTLLICSALFLLGLMSDYLFRKPASEGAFWASLFYTLTPNWANFWVTDIMEYYTNLSGFFSYVGKVFIYAFCYIGAALLVAIGLFENRELS